MTLSPSSIVLRWCRRRQVPAKFTVAVDGGSGPGEGTAGVTPDPADAATISVGDASPGSGTRGINIAQAVTINSIGNTLTFTYTATGAITDRTLDIRVKVPSWLVSADRQNRCRCEGKFRG